MAQIIFEDGDIGELGVALGLSSPVATLPYHTQGTALAAYALFTGRDGVLFLGAGTALTTAHYKAIAQIRALAARTLDDEQQSHLKYVMRERGGLAVPDDADLLLYRVSENIYLPIAVTPWTGALNAMMANKAFLEQKFLTPSFLGASIGLPGGSDFTRTLVMGHGLIETGKDGMTRFMQAPGESAFKELKTNILQGFRRYVQDVDADYNLSGPDGKVTDVTIDAQGRILLSADYSAIAGKMNIQPKVAGTNLGDILGQALRQQT